MTIIACARRKTDGLLTWPQTSPQAPDQSAIIQKGVNSFGGVADDWEYATLTEEQFGTIRAGMPGRAYLDISGEFDEIVDVSVPRTPITSVDKNEIEDDGVDEAVISFDTTDATYIGDVRFIVTGPDENTQILIKSAVAGVATLSVSSLLPGTISIHVRAELYGDGHITLEAI